MEGVMLGAEYWALGTGCWEGERKDEPYILIASK